MPESRKYIRGILQAAELINEFVSDRTLNDYLGDVFLRSAAERQLQIIGKGLGQMARRDQALANQMPGLGQIVAFRNTLVHGNAIVDSERV